MEKILSKFIDRLSGILKEPPYLIFVFIGGVFVFVSLLTRNSREQVWTFFVYAIGGTIWRYAAKDFLSHSNDRTVKIFKKNVKCKLITHIIFHIGNVCLFFTFVYYLLHPQMVNL